MEDVDSITPKDAMKSKTILVNVAAAIFSKVLQSRCGVSIDPQVQVYVIIGLNIILREFTKGPIKWRT